MAFINAKISRAIIIPGPQDAVRSILNWMTRRAKRREITALLQQEEFVLKDIGVTRGDVHEALASSGDPSLNLRVLAARRRCWIRSREQL